MQLEFQTRGDALWVAVAATDRTGLRRLVELWVDVDTESDTDRLGMVGVNLLRVCAPIEPHNTRRNLERHKFLEEDIRRQVGLEGAGTGLELSGVSRTSEMCEWP